MINTDKGVATKLTPKQTRELQHKHRNRTVTNGFLNLCYGYIRSLSFGSKHLVSFVVVIVLILLDFNWLKKFPWRS